MSDYPGLVEKFKLSIFEQKDPYKTFMLNVFKNIPHFNDLTPVMFHKIIYSFKEEIFENEELVQKVGDPTDFIIIVASGELEMLIELESNDFVLEKLRVGSIVNYHNFFFDEETFQVNLKCS